MRLSSSTICFIPSSIWVITSSLLSYYQDNDSRDEVIAHTVDGIENIVDKDGLIITEMGQHQNIGSKCLSALRLTTRKQGLSILAVFTIPVVNTFAIVKTVIR